MDAITRAVLKLEAAVGPSQVLTDADRCGPYARDESEAVGVVPPCVVLARTTEDIAAVLTICEAERVPVFPRAAGTGRTGGAVPMVPGVVLSTLGMNKVKDIDRENLVAVVEPGVITGEFHSLVESQGLFYPPDPQSSDSCSLGGNVAENAGGPRAFKYGVTREYVLGTETVVMGGERLRTGRRTVKGVTGYDVTALLVGSEGTLGVFTEITVRLVPYPPEVRTLVARFRDVFTAGRAVARIVSDGMVPRCLELLDSVCCDVLRERGADVVGPTDGALLVIEVDGSHPGAMDDEAMRVGEACTDVGATEVLVAQHGGERERLWQVRRSMSRALRARAKYKLSEDVVVPRSRVPELLERVAVISAEAHVPMPAYGHAGDGNLHVNLLWNDPSEHPAVHRAIEALFRTTIELGGTLSGEHGIGVLKAPYLHLEQSEGLMALQRRLKSVFDPYGLLNPGKVLPPRGHLAC